jgi:ADP-ribose pyrophosphatase YjhB (NUDIX family)
MDRYGEGGAAPATLNLYWAAQIVTGEPQPDDDIAELRWFDPDDLPPPDELAFHLAQVLSAWRDEHA